MKIIASLLLVLSTSFAFANNPSGSTTSADDQVRSTGYGKPDTGMPRFPANTGHDASVSENTNTTGVGKPAAGLPAEAMGKTALTQADCDRLTDSERKANCEAQIRTQR